MQGLAPFIQEMVLLLKLGFPVTWRKGVSSV